VTDEEAAEAYRRSREAQGLPLASTDPACRQALERVARIVAADLRREAGQSAVLGLLALGLVAVALVAFLAALL
jgi:hypothetical protein